MQKDNVQPLMTFDEAVEYIEATPRTVNNFPIMQREQIEYMQGHIIENVLTDVQRAILDEFCGDMQQRYTKLGFWRKWTPKLRRLIEDDSLGCATFFVASDCVPHIEYKSNNRAFTIHLRAIYDRTLKLTDRIVFSYLWSRAHWWEVKKRKWTKPTITHLRGKFGYRPNTLQKSLDRLQAKAYLTDDLRPVPTHPAIKNRRQYFMVKYTKDADVVRQVLDQRRKSGLGLSAGWAATTLGIGRRTYFRHVNSAA
jgi:hypothetical protein